MLYQVKAIIKKKDNDYINLKTKDGLSALCIAASNGNTELCDYLIKNGASLK